MYTCTSKNTMQGSVSLQHITAHTMHMQAGTTHLNNCLQCLEVGPFCVKDPLYHQLPVLILSAQERMGTT